MIRRSHMVGQGRLLRIMMRIRLLALSFIELRCKEDHFVRGWRRLSLGLDESIIYY